MVLYGFCMTINNYTEADERKVQEAVGNVGIKYIIYGVEEGALTHTPHLQCYFQSNRKNFDRLKNYFGRRVHLERQRGDSRAAADYCKKEGDWTEYGQYAHIEAVTQGQRNDIKTVRDMVTNGATYDEIIASEYIGTVARYDRFIKELIQERDYKKQLSGLQTRFQNSSLRAWQRDLMDTLEGAPHDREILWFWDDQGNTGKSWMATYLAANHGATVLMGGKKADMAYTLANKLSKIVIFDLPRTTQEYLNACYSLAEELKNGRFASTKYVSRTILCDTPHVLFLANFEPDTTKWSEDRYSITRIRA